ncbi:MAG TPA: transposase domain-containing protein, partial [Thermomonospora sp.]|nr:transposase domain-containing protein [Thermomonospora sp.]
GERNYDAVMRVLLDGLAWGARRRSGGPPPSASAISRARVRLGAEPLRTLFCEVRGPLAGPGTPGAWYAGRRLVTLDRAALDLPETADNAPFGYPAATARYPRVLVFALAEGGTEALLDGTFGGVAVGERTLAARMLRALRPGMLVVARADPWAADLWRQAAATGADLLWGCAAPPDLWIERSFGDGSYLARPVGMAGLALRVVPGPAGPGRAPAALLTTLTDPVAAPAGALAARYARRWAMDAALAWLRDTEPGRAPLLRSRTAELVAQEVWALLCVHQALRTLTCPARDSRPPRNSTP